MALSGTLSDLDVIDLIQFPGSINKTGELIIQGQKDNAHLFYEGGKLKHAICGSSKGIEALVSLVSWQEGNLKFQLENNTNENSVNMDFHRALMTALKIWDNRQKKQSIPPKDTLPGLFQILSTAAQNFSSINAAAVFTLSGEMVCKWTNEKVNQTTFNKMITGAIDVFSMHPRKELQKLYLIDTKGTCVGARINTTRILFLASNQESSLGVISIAASKICAKVLKDGR